MLIYSVLKCVFENNSILQVINKKTNLSSLLFAACIQFPALQWTFQILFSVWHELAKKAGGISYHIGTHTVEDSKLKKCINRCPNLPSICYHTGG